MVLLWFVKRTTTNLIDYCIVDQVSQQANFRNQILYSLHSLQLWKYLFPLQRVNLSESAWDFSLKPCCLIDLSCILEATKQGHQNAPSQEVHNNLSRGSIAPHAPGWWPSIATSKIGPSNPQNMFRLVPAKLSHRHGNHPNISVSLNCC